MNDSTTSPYSNAVLSVFVAVFIDLLIVGDILLGRTSDDSVFAYLILGNLGLGLAASMLVRFRAKGMTWVLSVMAAGHVGIGAIAVVQEIGTTGVVLAVNGILAAFFGVAAWMFWHAATHDAGEAPQETSQ